MACKKHQPGQPCCGCTLCGKCLASISLLDCVPLTFAWPVVTSGDSCGPFGATNPNNSSQQHTGCKHTFQYCSEVSTTTNYTYTDDCLARSCGTIETYSGYYKTHSLNLTIVEQTKVTVEVEQYPAPFNQVRFYVKIEKNKFVSYVDTVTVRPLTIICASGPGGSRVLTINEGETYTETNTVNPGTIGGGVPCAGGSKMIFNQCVQQFAISPTSINCSTICDVKTLNRTTDSSSGNTSLDLPRGGTLDPNVGCVPSNTAPTVSIPRPTCCGTTVQVQLDCIGA